MSDVVITPSSIDELAAVVTAEERVLPVGHRTKQPLCASGDATVVSLTSIRGIIQYEPSEFTFTARAGTPVAEIEAALDEKRQYLPFDPMLVDAGATLGGTVASGLSGPGRFRYGGIRDFLLGAGFISGDGDVINAGGKVVKNSAGFDLPKFLIGSMGRLGVMTELTFKVFPKPIATHTLSVECDSHAQAGERMSESATSRWELDAIDYRPDQRCLLLRVAGSERVNASVAAEIRSRWGDEVSDLQSSDQFWHAVRELKEFEHSSLVIKIPTTPGTCHRLYDSLGEDNQTKIHASVAGNVLWLWVDSLGELAIIDQRLESLQIAGLVVRGSCSQPRIGHWNSFEMEKSIKAAMDPPGRFLNF